YEQLCTGVEAMLTVPEHFNFVTDMFERWRSDRLAILWLDDAGGERRFSWSELSSSVDRVANVLRAHGVRKGDRVFIQVGRIPEWWQTMLACLKIGAIAMPGTAMLTPKDIAYRISLSEPIAVVTESAYASRFDEVREKALSVRAYLAIGDARERWIDFRAERDRAPATAPTESTLASDYALLYFTSGTTGYPKMVMHTQASYGVGHTVTAKYWIALSPDDLHWNVSDTGWAKAAWSSLFGPIIAGSAQLIHNPSGAVNAKRVHDILAARDGTTTCGPPTICR